MYAIATTTHPIRKWPIQLRKLRRQSLTGCRIAGASSPHDECAKPEKAITSSRGIGSTETPRDRIFAAARDLFDADGLAGLSMRKIADAVGLTPMAIYKHYPDKDALVDALMLDGFVAWEDRVRKLSAKAPVRWLEQFFDAFLDFSFAEPRRYEAAFLLPARTARQYPDDFAAGRSPALNMAYQRIEEARGLGLIDDTPA